MTVIVAEYVPGVVEPIEQDMKTVELAARLRVVAGQRAVRAVEEVTAEMMPTVPTKLKLLETVTFSETPLCPAFRFAGTVVIWKSPT